MSLYKFQHNRSVDHHQSSQLDSLHDQSIASTISPNTNRSANRKKKREFVSHPLNHPVYSIDDAFTRNLRRTFLVNKTVNQKMQESQRINAINKENQYLVQRLLQIQEGKYCPFISQEQYQTVKQMRLHKLEQTRMRAELLRRKQEEHAAQLLFKESHHIADNLPRSRSIYVPPTQSELPPIYENSHTKSISTARKRRESTNDQQQHYHQPQQQHTFFNQLQEKSTEFSFANNHSRHQTEQHQQYSPQQHQRSYTPQPNDYTSKYVSIQQQQQQQLQPPSHRQQFEVTFDNSSKCLTERSVRKRPIGATASANLQPLKTNSAVTIKNKPCYLLDAEGHYYRSRKRTDTFESSPAQQTPEEVDAHHDSSSRRSVIGNDDMRIFEVGNTDKYLKSAEKGVGDFSWNPRRFRD